MKYLTLTILLSLSGSAMAAKPDMPWFSVQVGYGLMHASDYDWRKMVWARPSYQFEAGWRRFGLRAIYFDFGQHGQYLGSLFYGQWGVTKVGTATERHYNFAEYLATYSLIPSLKSRLQIGIGGSHVKGDEMYAKAVFDKGFYFETIETNRYRNEWGGILEINYDRFLWKYVIAGIGASYRVYPNVDGLLNCSLKVGIIFPR